MLTVSSLLSLVITAAARWRDSRLARKCDHKKHKLLTGCPGKWHSKVMLSSNIPSIFTFIEAISTWPKWQTWPILTFILFIKLQCFYETPCIVDALWAAAATPNSPLSPVTAGCWPNAGKDATNVTLLGSKSTLCCHHPLQFMLLVVSTLHIYTTAPTLDKLQYAI